MGIRKAIFAGLGRVVRAPSLVLWVYAANLLVAAPLAYAMRTILSEAIGGGLVADKLRAGFDWSWHGEFEYSARGIGKTFGPGVTGVMPVLENLEKLLDGKLAQTAAPVVAAGAVFLLVWVFLSGGILDRMAHTREEHSRGRFFGACGEYFWRFGRMAAISLGAYGAIAYFAGRPLFRWVDVMTRDVTVERTVMVWTAGAYAVVGLLMVVVGMVVDYAKIAMVVEKRRSAVVALLRGLAFVARNPVKTFGLYFALLVVSLAVLLMYAWVAPGPGQATWMMLGMAMAVSQAFIVARIGMKLWFLGSETAMFQRMSGAAEMEEMGPARVS